MCTMENGRTAAIQNPTTCILETIAITSSYKCNIFTYNFIILGSILDFFTPIHTYADMAEKQEEKSPPRAGDYRDSYQQKKYREESKSKYKDSKEVAHILSGQILSKVLATADQGGSHRSRGRPPKNETDDVRELSNAPSNMRMVNTSTNRQEHVKADNALVRKADSGEKLTRKEEGRARQQVASVQSDQDKLRKVTYKSHKKFYDKLETQSGRNVWDGRKDKHDKR